MPVHSKWQSLPTEQINPATLAIDKLSPADIVEGMLNEDRKMLAAVQREKERIAVGVETSGCAMSVSTSSRERNFGSAGHARGERRSSAGLPSRRPSSTRNR